MESSAVIIAPICLRAIMMIKFLSLSSLDSIIMWRKTKKKLFNAIPTGTFGNSVTNKLLHSVLTVFQFLKTH